MTTATDQPTALVVHESMFGNTAQLGRAIAVGLRRSGVDVRITDVATAPAADDLDVDLIVLGAPTHAFSLSRPSTRADAVRQGAPADRAAVGAREWLVAARTRGSDPLVAVFDTRVSKVHRLPAAAAKAARLARRHGFRVLGDPVGFRVLDTAGPIEEGELDRATAWGEWLAMHTESAAARG